MATTSENKRIQEGVWLLTATFTAENDAVVLDMPRVTSMSLQATGTFGSAVLHLQATNDSTNYVALPTATNLSAAGIKSVAIADLGFRRYRLIVLTAAPGGTLTANVVGMEAR